MEAWEAQLDIKTLYFSRVYIHPDLNDGVQLTGHANAWTYGAWTQIVAANAITRNFHVIGVIPLDASFAENAQVQLAYGVNDTVFANLRARPIYATAMGANQAINIDASRLMVGLIPANSRVRARLATQSGGGDTIDIVLQYREFLL